MASPQRHPCYEFGIQLTGVGMEFVGGEQAERGPGDLLLAAPGVPHWIEISEYPLDFVTVYFLPTVLIDLGPEGSGLKILRRFTSPRTIQERLVRPSRKLRTWLEKKFGEMVHEFEHRHFGREIILRSLLFDMLVQLIRWEYTTGQHSSEANLPVEWQRVHKALEFLQAHYKQPIYANDVAHAADVTESQLKRLFHDSLGLTWGKYLQHYRIHRAVGLLGQHEFGILETALEVGFETMSHFNATFREIMGFSPREYRRRMVDSAAGEQTQTATQGPRQPSLRRGNKKP